MTTTPSSSPRAAARTLLNKVPEVTLYFWPALDVIETDRSLDSRR